MALVVNDRVKETSATTGTGTFTLAGAVVGFETFSSAIGNTNTTYYTIVNEDGEFEVGLGTVAAGTLARTTIISSSNSDSAVNFSSGTKDVFCTLPASKAVILDSSGNIVANNGSNLTALNATQLTSGTVPDARFPATLPAANGSALTDLNATELTSGTIPDARFPSSIVTLTGTETLTNKTLTDAVAITNSTTGEIIPGKQEGTNFTNSLLVGHATTGTLNAATSNTGVGIGALDALTSGDQNTAVGNDSLTSTTTGYQNVGVGVNSLYYNGSGKENVAIGYGAKQNNSTGDANTAIGFGSLLLTSGNKNIGIGYQAGDNISSGAGNVIIGGVDAGSATDDRQLVIAGNDGTTTTTWISGDSDGLLTITGGEVIPGKKEGTNFINSLLIGHSTTGTLDAAEQNTAVGINAMDAITSGFGNTTLGYNSGTDITSGGDNTFTGKQAGANVSSGNYNTGIGSNTLYSGNFSGCTAVGKNAIFGLTGSNNTAVGYVSLKGVSGQNGHSNTALGEGSGELMTTGAYNLCLGRSAGDNITTGDGNIIIGGIDADSATADKQLIIADGVDGSVAWIKGDSSGNLVTPGTITANGAVLTNKGTATILAMVFG